LSGYGSRAFLDVELKVAGLENKAIEEIADSGTTYDRLVVSSFLPAVLQKSRALDRELPLGFLCEEPAALPLWRDLPIDYVIVHHRLVTADLVGVVHSAGRKVFAWTVNRPEDMLRVAEWSVDGIISDDPSLLVSTLGSFSR
jgi:glycerophosphoryl diester phosphodiesterase